MIDNEESIETESEELLNKDDILLRKVCKVSARGRTGVWLKVYKVCKVIRCEGQVPDMQDTNISSKTPVLRSRRESCPEYDRRMSRRVRRKPSESEGKQNGVEKRRVVNK